MANYNLPKLNAVKQQQINNLQQLKEQTSEQKQKQEIKKLKEQEKKQRNETGMNRFIDKEIHLLLKDNLEYQQATMEHKERMYQKAEEKVKEAVKNNAQNCKLPKLSINCKTKKNYAHKVEQQNKLEEKLYLSKQKNIKKNLQKIESELMPSKIINRN